MNYNTWTFWALFGIIILPYWWLKHRQQNRLLLVASYLFYGFWDYRFLFLILVSTVIDYIGGLGVAGVMLPKRRLRNLGALLMGSSLLLCSNVRYGDLWQGVHAADLPKILTALPHRLSDFYLALAVVALTLGYGFVLPWLYTRPVEQRRKLFLTISMVANLGILGFFKYFDFFITSFQRVLDSAGLGHWGGHTLAILLPAGISFYTFQAMSYTIDIYRKEIEPTDNFPDFALFVCFFPHLVAGPIMRASTLLPQVTKPRSLRAGDVEEGFLLVLIGLFKKVIIADNMAPMANAVFNRFADGTSAGLTGSEVLVGLYAFAFQIYGDFSGYSSIARGISKWLGFDLVINFRMPYLAVSPSDFWKRWHISLSTWLRDYLYIPLGGNRGGGWMLYRNLMLTMLLGGLWHGASWTFVAWGFFHGAILCLFRLFKIKDVAPDKSLLSKLHFWFRVVVMFHLTCIGWLLFRADSFQTIQQMSVTLLTNFRLSPMALTALIMILVYAGILLVFEYLVDGEARLNQFTQTPWMARALVYTYLCGMFIFFQPQGTYEFIYFQF